MSVQQTIAKIDVTDTFEIEAFYTWNGVGNAGDPKRWQKWSVGDEVFVYYERSILHGTIGKSYGVGRIAGVKIDTDFGYEYSLAFRTPDNDPDYPDWTLRSGVSLVKAI